MAKNLEKGKQELIEKFLKNLEKNNLSISDIQTHLVQKQQLEKLHDLPVSIFSTEKLSSLEIIVKYLRETGQLKFRTIAELLGRNEKSINSTYRVSLKKFKGKIVHKPSEFIIPVSIFTDRKLSILEHIAVYLKDTYNLSYHKIALMLHKNDRTVWTVYNRAMKKTNKQRKKRNARK